MECHQNDSNSCYFSGLASASTALGEEKYTTAVKNKIEESLYCQSEGYKDRVSFAIAIMSDQVKKPGEQRLHYNIQR